jgi:hypothetical protein
LNITGADKTQELGGVQDEPDVVEGRSDESTPTDKTLLILILEGILQI